MKHNELIKILTKSGCQMVKHGKKHDKWYSPVTGKYDMIPRHGCQEVKKGLAESIIRRLIGE